MSSRDEKGFELLVGMKLQLKAKKIPGSLRSETAYALSAASDVTEDTRWALASAPPSSRFPPTQHCGCHATDTPMTSEVWLRWMS